ncbi:MAG TPA: tetratricopeptide repeat protein, partial [Chloroflexota bacterium]|nr:tetratricopeptide repeat protein [Chloroflexota bacterium]
IEGYQQRQDLESAGRATVVAGLAHRRRGTTKDGVALLEPMIERLTPSGPSPALASLHVTLSQLYMLVGRYREMLEPAERGGEIARAQGDERLLGEAEMRRGVALDVLDQPEQGLCVLAEALPLVEGGGDLLTLSTTLGNMGAGAERLGWMEQARRHFKQALAVAERIGNPSQLCFAHANLGICLFGLGEWQEARRVLERALPLLETAGRGSDAAMLLASLGELALYEGSWGEASRTLREALAIAQEAGFREGRDRAQVDLAALEVLRGRPREAIERLEPLAEGEAPGAAVLLPYLAWAHLRIGDEHLQQAAYVAEQAVTRARKLPGTLADALWVQGMVLIRQGRHQEAERVLTEGAALAHEMPFPYFEARILVQLGILAQQQGKPEEARQRLEEALTIFRRLGAEKDVEQVEGMLGES